MKPRQQTSTAGIGLRFDTGYFRHRAELTLGAMRSAAINSHNLSARDRITRSAG